MKKIVISMQNILLSEAIAKSFYETGEFRIEQILPGKTDDTLSFCCAMQPDVLLMEVSHVEAYTLKSRLKLIDDVRKNASLCKFALLCDENSDGELARRVQEKSVPRGYCGGEGEHACVTIIGKVGRCRNLRVDKHSADRRVQPAGEPGQLIRRLAADRRHLYGVLIEVLHTVHEDLLGARAVIGTLYADVELEGVRGTEEVIQNRIV